MISINTIDENTNSYDKSCAVDRIAPIKAYLELAAQPDTNIP
jgi:hypothetical protein